MILLIDHYDSFTYNLVQMLSQIDTVCVRRSDKISLTEIEEMAPSAIVLSPGPGHPNQAGIFIDVIRTFGPHTLILGICLGHQAIAAAFGASIVRAPEIVHGKPSEIFHHREALFEELPLPFTAGRYHSLIVDRHTVPSCLKVIAETGEGHIMAIQHEEYPIFGLQFHPESILTPLGDALIRACFKQGVLC